MDSDTDFNRHVRSVDSLSSQPQGLIAWKGTTLHAASGGLRPGGGQQAIGGAGRGGVGAGGRGEDSSGKILSPPAPS